MAKVSGSYLVAKALENEGVDTVFYLMGGPISPIIAEAEKLGLTCYYAATSRLRLWRRTLMPALRAKPASA